MDNPLNPENMFPNQMNEHLKSIEQLLKELVELTRQLVEITEQRNK